MVSMECLLVLASLLSVCFCFSFSSPDAQKLLKDEPQGYFDWTSITPSKHLKWHPCYERHECARLEVPMDPKNASLHDTVTVAVIRDPVKISRSDPTYGGSIFFNPGGPGGSGINYIRWAGYEIRNKIEGPKHFDLVSWDPRGVGATAPQPFCFDSELERQLYWLKQEAVGMVDESEYALHYQFQAAKAFGQACNSTIMRYMTTLATVQDMIAVADALEPDVKEPLINFWGISYGTFIGNTLASAFPHRISKIVLDGVVGSQDYTSDMWRHALVDTEKILDKFCETCHNVGPSRCPFYEHTPHGIRAKIDRLIESLHKSPIPISYPIAPHRTASLLTSGILRTQILGSLYTPQLKFPFLAQMLHDLTQSPPNTTLIAPLITALSDPHDPPDTTAIRPTNNTWENPYPPASSKNSLDSERIIACTDADPIHNYSIQDYTSYIDDLRSTFPLVAGSWANTMTTCTGWPESKRAPPHMRFPGPFGSNLSSYDVGRGARPILFVGNQADPVCPLSAAQGESAKHEGSVVLRTDIFGHVSVPLNPSRCVWGILRRYWNFGELPEQGMVCEGDWDTERWGFRDGEDRSESDMLR